MGGAETPAPSQQAAVAALAVQQHLLDTLLKQHTATFEELRGLPSARPYDHHIHLLPNMPPVAVRP